MHTRIFTQDNFDFRPIDESDLDNLILLDGDPEVRQFFPEGTLTVAKIKDKIALYQSDFAKNDYGIFAVFDHATKEFIGRAGFGDAETGETEIGYLLQKKFWGKGYATRIVKVLLTWAKANIKKDKIIAYTPIEHIASQKVMEKAGMTFVKQAHLRGTDCVVYEIKL